MSETSGRLIALLPWLNLHTSVSLADVTFVPFKDNNGNITPSLEELGESLRVILSGFVDLEGNPIVSCTVVCIKGRNPAWDLSLSDQAVVQRAVQFLSLAALSANEYYAGGIGNYANTSTFQMVLQRFTEPPKWVSFQIRRRDGRTIDGGYQHGEVHITVPLACRLLRFTSIDEGFMEGLNSILASNSNMSRRLMSALSFFNLANSDSETMLQEAEVILTASAFEQLLETSGALGLSCGVGELLEEFGSVKIEAARSVRPGIALDRKYESEQIAWFVHRKWAEELYDLRSQIIHGELLSEREWGWSLFEHLVMGAFVFPLLVKLCLAKEGRYAPSNEDKIKCQAIDRLLSRTRWHDAVGSSSIATVWREVTLATRFRRTYPQPSS